MSLLYLDTARLGRTCPSAFRTQLDFNRLSADDPSMYSEDFLRDGSRVWSRQQISDYPAFALWEGVQSFKSRVAQHFGVSSASSVFLANRSSQLVRIAARLMFRTCRNVLTTDLNWPHWQAIVEDEAARSGQAVTKVALTESVFGQHVSAAELTTRVQATFFDHGCDGVFLPALSNLGVRLPVSNMISYLRSSGELRFALIDSAQSFCHLPPTSSALLANVAITGCHKWLRGMLPMGIAVCGRPLVSEQIQAILKMPASSCDVEDPLLRFTQELCGQSVNKFSETVNIAPMFSANAAIRSNRVSEPALRAHMCRQRANLTQIDQATKGTSWRTVSVDPSLRSGVTLIRSSSPHVRAASCSDVRQRFRHHGIVLSTYPDGLARLSAPTELVSSESIATLATAFERVS